jgi:hypothetical protein
VNVDLETLGIRQWDALHQLVARDHHETARFRFVRVRLEHHRGVGFHDTVGPEFDHVDPQTAARGFTARLLERLNLIHALFRIPEDRERDAEVQFALLVEGLVGGQ